MAHAGTPVEGQRGRGATGTRLSEKETAMKVAACVLVAVASTCASTKAA
jgi:hypothetical protein